VEGEIEGRETGKSPGRSIDAAFFGGSQRVNGLFIENKEQLKGAIKSTFA